jgi:glutamyl-tRNA reductase
MKVGVLGVNHKLACLRLRELLARICQRRFHPGHLAHEAHAFVLLSTCNRTEVYFSSENLADTHSYLLNVLRHDLQEDFDQKLYSYFGQDCLQHLSRVTSGLDSAIVAETEIQGQVKAAYKHAQESEKLPFELHYLFQKSLSIAKKVRTVLPVKPGLPDISHAVFQTGHHFFHAKPEPKILFVGASAINDSLLSFFQGKNLSNLFLCNRSAAAGEAMAKKYQIPLMPWNKLDDWSHYDWILLGTTAPEFLIRQDSLVHLKDDRKLIIDLSVPRNADPAIARHPQITLLNIDQINRRLKIRRNHLSHSLQTADRLLLELIQAQMKRFYGKEREREEIWDRDRICQFAV